MRLLHLTDPHLAIPPFVTLARHGLKRWLGYRSWHKRRAAIHQLDVLEQLSHSVHSEAADIILVTGDLGQIGTLEELEAGAQWLRSLGSAQQVLFVPGNHDLYAPDSVGNIKQALAEYWPANFPVVRSFPAVTVIGLNSALPNSVLSARGKLGKAQLAGLDDALANEGSGTLRVIGLHHPPTPPGPNLLHWRKALADHKALNQSLAAAQPYFLLHGHEHKSRIRAVTPQRYQIATASASGIGACYRRFDIERNGSGYIVEAGGVAWQEQGLCELPVQSWQFS